MPYKNQFLNGLFKNNVIGVSLILFSVMLSFCYLMKNNNKYTWTGSLIITIYIITSLINIPFQHTQTLTFYFIIMYLLSSHSNQHQNEISNNN